MLESENSKQTADRLLTKKQVLALVPYSAVHLYRLIDRGDFPKQCRCSANRVAWSAKEVHAWIEEKKNARIANNGEGV